jgi:Ser/Thr protein kinase RdoA (MazF antagonist)
MNQWSEDDVRAFLAPYGLEPSDLGVRALAGGEDNLNLLIEADRKRVVLRRYNITRATEVDFELELVRILCQRHFPTAPLITRGDGGLWTPFLGGRAALFGFVAGQHPDGASVPAGEQVARTIAELHQITRGITLSQPRSRTDLNRLRRIEEFAAEQGQRLSDPDLGAFLAHVRAFREPFLANVARHAAVLPTGVVHHDVNPGNVLMNERGELAALLDFDEAHVGYLLTDLGSLVHYWGMDGVGRGIHVERVSGYLHAYNEQRPLLEAEWELLPDFILLFWLADAAEYVTRALLDDPTACPVAECHSYATFLALTGDVGWRDRLRPCVQEAGDARCFHASR